jgi:hypothetical protein
MITYWWREGVPSAGLFAGSLAWAINTELNYALVSWICAAGLGWITPVLTAFLFAMSLFGGLLSWRAWTNTAAEPVLDSSIAQPRRFLAGISVLSAVLFALVIATQGSAGLILNGCER